MADDGQAREHFTDPFLLGALALTILTILVGTALRRGDLSPRDRRVATWYLLNGAEIRMLPSPPVLLFLGLAAQQTNHAA